MQTNVLKFLQKINKGKGIKFLFIALLCLSRIQSAAQFTGYPIRNYTPKEYKGFTQNWDCVQDNRGVLYFGNSSDVLEYDGRSWRRIPIAPGVAVRSLCIDTAGTIYVGSVGEFGLLAPQKDGKLVYQSLSKNLSVELKQFADVWKIHEDNGTVIFQTSENLFQYKNNKITIVTPGTSFSTLSFVVNNNFYVRERQKGLMKLVNNKLQIVKGGELFYDEAILGIISYGNKKLILSGENGFFLMDEKNGRIDHLPVRAEEYLVNSGVLGLQWLNDSTIYINSRAGLIFLNKKLEFQKVISKADGLNDETVAQMFVDRQKELWLTTNNGISRVSINSPLYYYNNSSGFNGNIQAITIFQKKIILGTTVGMYQAVLDKQNMPGQSDKLKFQQIEGTFFEVWNFHEHEKRLLAATSDGIFQLVDNHLERITKPYANDISSSARNKDVILISEKGGLRLMKNIGKGEYKLLHFFEFTADDIMTAEEFIDPKKPENESQVWLTTRNKGVLKLEFDENYKFKVSKYDMFNDVLKQQVQIINEKGKLYFCTAKGSYLYDSSKDKGDQECFVLGDPGIYPYDQNGVHPGYWDSISRIGKKAIVGMRSLEEVPYTFYQDNENILWIGLTNELVRFDGSVEKDYKSGYNSLIRKVIIGKDSLLFAGAYSLVSGDKRIVSADQGTDQIQTLPYKNNSITFEYAAAFFEREEKTMFSYKLVGFDTAWSSWSSNTLKQYTNLFEGEYAFIVRSKNVYGREGRAADFKFIISPPWYRTWLAYASYAVLFILLIILIVKLSMSRLIAAKEKLERLVTERTTEVVLQKEELQQKNTIIEVAYNDIRSSINYAKRIQESILPLKQEIKNSFEESFVLFKPRDIVSGDFYWFTNHLDKKIIACVDCTGHGVPGAFMSMIGNTLLNQIVNEKNIIKPSDILNLLHERVRQSLKQDLENNETRDGMDLALCVFDDKRGILKYAGANRPIYIIRGGILQEYKPTKSPIGGDQMEEDKKFINNEIEIFSGDIIYMSTDGYADQFGGERGKKLMVKRFHQLLVEIHHKPMEEQGRILKETIEKWQGNNEQVDDILVIGIKI